MLLPTSAVRRGMPLDLDKVYALAELLEEQFAGRALNDRTLPKLEAALSAMKLRIVGAGSQRIVVALGKEYVGKIDLDPSGAANALEERNYREWYRFRAFLVPVVGTWADDRLLVMPRVQGFYFDVPKKWQGKLAEAQAVMDFVDDAWMNPNWGVYEGRVALLDYAQEASR